MKIDVAKALMNEGEVFSAAVSGVLADIEHMGERYSFAGPAHAEADYWFDGEGMTVNGRFSAKITVVCSRCLKEILYPVDFRFTEHYKESLEDGVYPYTGDEIDLDRMLCDNVVLSLPLKFLCSEDCKGLCGICGKDLNNGQCGCTNEVDAKNPFYSLSKLYDDEEV